MSYHRRFEQGDNSNRTRGQENNLVDMTDANHLTSVFRHQHHSHMDQSPSSGQLSFDNSIYPNDSLTAGTGSNDCRGDASQSGRDSSNQTDSSNASNLEHLQALVQQLEQEIETILTEIKQLSQGNAEGDSSAGATSAGGSDNTTQTGSDSTSPASSNTNSSDSTTTSSTTDATNQSSGTSDAPVTSTTSDRPEGTTAATGALDSVMAQSPNATGPLTLDSSVNNASVVGFVGATPGANVDHNAQVDFKNMKSYVHLKTGGWVQIEDQNNSQIIGGLWKDDMKGDNTSMTVQNSQNDATMAAPPAGWVDHFWLHDGGGTIDASKVDGFFSTADAKASVPNSGLSASLGIDWFKPDGSSDGRFGSGTALTDQWQTLYHTTLDRKTLENDPPPGIATTGDASASTAAEGSSAATSPSRTGDSTTSTQTGAPAAKLINLFPQNDSQWQRYMTSPKGSMIVVESSPDVNPKYDMPFGTIDPALQQHITDANAAGMATLGYVGSANGTKPLDVAKQEIDDWVKTGVKGVYIGNSGKADDSGYATDPASEQYFEEIATYAKSKGLMAVINGSGTPNPDYANYYDVQGTVEDAAQNYGKYPEAAWQSNYSSSHFSAVLGGVPISDLKSVENEMIAKNNGYIAVGDTYPTPMTDEYWNQLIANLYQA